MNLTIMRRLVEILGVLACLFAWVGPASAQSHFKFFEPVTPPREVKVVARRGMQNVAPESSAAAIRACVDDYVEWAEVDVRMTKDGKHVVLHDETLDRTTNGKGPVADVTLDEFVHLDGGSWYAPRFKAQPPLTVEALLKAARGKVNVLLDCKQIEPAALVAKILAHQMESQVIVRAPHPVLVKVRAAGKNAIATMGKFVPTMADFESFVKEVDPAVVEIPPEEVSAEWCRRFRERGIKVHVHPLRAELDVPATWTKLLEMGVDMIQTDHPAGVRFTDVRQRIPTFPVGIAYHRGANRYAPENTLPAIRTAVALGADYVEIDIRTTQDGKFVLVHDGSLDRTTDGKGRVSEMTADGVLALDAGAWFGKPFAGTRVPTFEEGLAALGETTGAYLDAKEIAPESLLEAMRAHRLLNRSVVYQSEQYLAKLRALDPNVRAMPPLRSAADFGRVAATKPYAVDANWRALSKELIDRLHAAGIKVFSDALGLNESVDRYRQAMDWGIDVIQTDHPLRVLRAVELQTNAAPSPVAIEWSRLPSLPDKEGFATMFAGTSGGALVVAGGANFPRGFPWEGGIKGWYDTIYVLDRPEGKWRVAAEKLPRPLAYGVSATWDGALVCAGGSDLKRHYADVFALRLVDGRIQTETLPALPQPCANMCGCLVGSRLFVAGGTASPDATTAMKTFWSLDLAEPKESRRWRELEPWPGLERSHSVAAALHGSFVIMSGFRWKAGPKGEVVRIAPFQTDCYRYTPRSPTEGTWKRLADAPRAIGAAPTPAMTPDPAHIYVIGGIDDSAAIPEPATHPGFPPDIFCYDAKADRWSVCGQMPAGSSRVTASTVVWQGRYCIINGERAPGRRSPDIHTAVIPQAK